MVTRYLLDTNVFSERSKPKPNPAVLRWLRSLQQNQVYLSVLTIGEIRYGIDKHKDPKRRSELQSWLEEDLAIELLNQIVDVDWSVAEKWGSICAHSENTLAAIDSLLGATALVHNFVLATRNTKHFRTITGLEVINPWDYP